MKHYIVIPPAAFNIAATGSAMGGAITAASAPKNLGALLKQKRAELNAFASVMLNSASGLGGFAAAAGNGVSTVTSTTKKKKAKAAKGKMPADGGITVLPAVGALVVPEDMVDRAAVEGSLGATVIENFFVPLEGPIPKAAGTNNAGIKKDWHLTNMNVAAARTKGITGKNILVGVLDTGIDAKGHPEFAGKKIHFAEFGMTGQLISTKMRDAGTHGTHVSGIIAGKKAGVAPQADLAVAAVLTIPGPNGLGGYFAQILGGLNWLLTFPFTGDPNNPGVDVLNASLGGGGYNTYYYQTLANARLVTGTVMAAAIGNAGPLMNKHGSPGNYDIVVGVGASDPQQGVASFSDWGTVSQHSGLAKPDLCAPGHPIYSSLPKGKYGWMSGTSMASPAVAGALCLLLEQTPSFSLNAPALVSRLYQLVTPFTPALNPNRGGRGRLDLTAI